MSKVPILAVIHADKSIALRVAKFIESSGFAVEVFASAQEFLRSRSIVDTACLIIDSNLPGMSGLELQSHLASASRHIPIIFITASSSETDRARALELGAVDLLHKASGEKALLKEIRSTLRLRD